MMSLDSFVEIAEGEVGYTAGSNGYTKYGYNYIKVKVLVDGNIGYMAKTYLV